MTDTPPAPSVTGRMARSKTPIALGIFTLLAAAYTWPLILGRDGVLYTRQFDLYGVIWASSRAWVAVSGGTDPNTLFPLGQNMARVDAWLHILASITLSPLLSPARIAAMFALFGPVFSALAAEYCSRKGLGVPFPWSLIAGIVYGFNGLAATAWLEGHVYFLLAPWLPLLVLFLLRATGPGARAVDGLLVGVCFVLSLLTTAYFGVYAAILIVVLALRGFFIRARRRLLLRPFLSIAAVVLPAGLLYVRHFMEGQSSALTPGGWVGAGSLTLATLTTWTPETDTVLHHSIAAPIGFLTLALLLVAPLELRRENGWRTLLGCAAMAVWLAFGSELRVGLGDPMGVPSLWGLLERLPGASMLHFPVRFMWLYYLCGGLVASKVASALAGRVGFRWALPLLLMATVDALAGTGAPFRKGAVPADAPSVYLQAPEGQAVLDLVPEFSSEIGNDDPGVFRGLFCYYQTIHHRPIMESCLMPIDDPRRLVSRRLMARLFDIADAPSEAHEALLERTREELAEIGVGAIALHLDFFRAEGRSALLNGLATIAGTPPRLSENGGETIALFIIPGPYGSEPAAAYARMLEQANTTDPSAAPPQESVGPTPAEMPPTRSP